MARSGSRPGGRDWRISALALLIATAVAFLQADGAPAQAGLTITDGGVENNFPDGMAFSVSVESEAPIERLRLRYNVLPDGTAAIGEPEFEPSTAIEAKFELAGPDDPNLYFPPGTVIDYYWEATDADGNEVTTETATFFYDDARFDWQPASDEGITIYYYSGSDDDAAEMLGVAIETVESMSGLLGTTIPFEVQVWIYDSVADMRPALRDRSETYESQITTAGVRVATNTVLVLGNVSFDTLRHELTHVVTAEAGESALGTLPAWLDEGTAVFGQNSPGGFEDAVERAISRENVFSVREIAGYPGDPDKVSLFYGQSWSLVNHLVQTYGEEQFARLFAEIKSGKRTDRALDAVYGFDQDGLDEEWRAANGLPPRETPEPTEAAQASDPPFVEGPEREDDDGGTSVALVIGLTVGILALAGAVGVAGLWAARRMN